MEMSSFYAGTGGRGEGFGGMPPGTILK